MKPPARLIAIDDRPELAKRCGQYDLLGPFDETFVLNPVGDQVFNCDDGEVMFFRDFLQIRKSGHCSVVLHDLADNARGVEARHSGQIHGALCVASPAKYTAGASTKGEDVAGRHKI